MIDEEKKVAVQMEVGGNLARLDQVALQMVIVRPTAQINCYSLPAHKGGYACYYRIQTIP